MVTALRDLCSWRLRPLLQWLLLTLKGYIRVSVLVRSPLKHTYLFFSVLMQMVRWFLERGWPQKRLGLQTQKELMSHAAGDTLRLSELSAQSPGRPGSVISTWYPLCFFFVFVFFILAVYLPLTLSSLCLSSLLSLCYLFLACRETSLLSSDGWMNTGLKPSWGIKLEFALCSLLR